MQNEPRRDIVSEELGYFDPPTLAYPGFGTKNNFDGSIHSNKLSLRASRIHGST
jgi:hypothetical protein